VAFFVRFRLLAYGVPQTLSLEAVGMKTSSRVVKTPPVPPVVEWDKLPLMLDEPEASVVAGVSVSFLRKSRCEGCKKPTFETRDEEESAPPFIRIGPKRVKYPTKDLQEWVAGLARKRVI
jgi:predicted DNA-binding transcriptional regulator AlpA